MKDYEWMGLLALGAFWLIGREFDAQKKRTEESEKRAVESEKRAVERDAETRAILLERIDDLEGTILERHEMDIEEDVDLAD